MVKKRQAHTVTETSSPELVWVVREGKECFDRGIQYLPGDVFPLENLPLDLQNLHIPNLERVPVEIPPGPPSKGGCDEEVIIAVEIPSVSHSEGGSEEEIVEIITQQEADPIYLGTDEDGGL